ncbi:tail fiber domain-containing protein [Burkholderia ubonensis]|uniref:tail fiber domain-containing protein n=1 Tax=Burkholderia ubonensis TaxID=101571 RepID=UPI0012FB5649|nr:tail fiber domain-containing protein [Burkholderia ubonensis]
MSDLQKVNQGTAPSGTDGDTVRVGFSKVNANTDVLRTQVALVSGAVITQPQALTSAHIGKRVSINLSSSGTVNLPAANTCPPDGVIALRNVGTTSVALAVSGGSGDTFPLSKLHPGEAALVDTDGLNAWGVLMRGRSQGDSETVDGDLRVMGAATFDARPTFAGKVPYDNGNLSPVDTKSDQSIGGKKDFSQRPTFAGKTPWDAGNFNPANYATLSGYNLFTGQVAVNRAPNTGDISGAGVLVNGLATDARIGLASYNFTAAVQMRCSLNMQLDVVDVAAGLWAKVAASAFNVTSDRAFKNDIRPLSDGLDKVLKLAGVYYSDANTGKASIGVIAQDVQEVFPEVVNVIDAEGHLAVDYSKLVGPLIESIKSLAVRVSELEANIAA